MKRSTIYKYALRAFFILGFTGLCGVARLIYRTTPITLKTNRTQTVVTTKKDIFSWLTQAANLYLFNAYLPTWQRGESYSRDQRKAARKILHYSPDIEHIIDNDPTKVTNHDHPTIYFHGWGDKKNTAKLLKAHCDVLPGDVILFNFRDRGIIFAKWAYSNLGQLPDVLSAIYVLKWTKDTLKPKAIDLFGHSRGGATLLNTIAVLHDTTGTYDEELKRIGITAEDRKTLLALIQKGSHVLNCPLTDMNMSINEFAKKAKVSKNDANDSFWVRAFESVTRYKRDGLQGITSAEQLEGLTLKMLVHFQHGDSVVSNKNDAALYKKLYRNNPASTFLVLGDNGGHLHTHEALAHTIHAFKKQYGGSYDPEYADQYQENKLYFHPANRLARPGLYVDKFISQYYAHCHAKNDKKRKVHFS